MGPWELTLQGAIATPRPEGPEVRAVAKGNRTPQLQAAAQRVNGLILLVPLLGQPS